MNKHASMRVYDHTKSEWAVAAEQQLLTALTTLRRGHDAIPAASAALTALRIEAGELPPDPGLLEDEDE